MVSINGIHFPSMHRSLSTSVTQLHQSNGGSQRTSCRILYPLPFIDIDQYARSITSCLQTCSRGLRFHFLHRVKTTCIGAIICEANNSSSITAHFNIRYIYSMDSRQTTGFCIQIANVLLHRADIQSIVCIRVRQWTT
jgi:hypothetical protein